MSTSAWRFPCDELRGGAWWSHWILNWKCFFKLYSGCCQDHHDRLVSYKMIAFCNLICNSSMSLVHLVPSTSIYCFSHVSCTLRSLHAVHYLSPSNLTRLAYHHYGATPLIFSILTGKLEVIPMLVAAGARMDIPNDRGKTAQHFLQQIDIPVVRTEASAEAVKAVNNDCSENESILSIWATPIIINLGVPPEMEHGKAEVHINAISMNQFFFAELVIVITVIILYLLNHHVTCCIHSMFVSRWGSLAGSWYPTSFRPV